MAGVLRTGRDDAVQVRGLAEFRRQLREIDTKLPTELRKANKDAAEVVAAEARRLGEAQGGVAAKTAPSIRAAATQTQAKVAIGGARYPFALGAEFGAKQYAQFEPWRGNQWESAVDGVSDVGYMVHPAVRDTRDEFMDLYLQMIDGVAGDAFPGHAVA